LLYRLTGEQDTVVGVAVDGRSYEGFTQALGLFAKIIPVHLRLKHDLTFKEVLDDLSQSLRDLHEWHDYFDWGAMAQPGQVEGSPFFPFCFSFEPRPAEYTARGASFSLYKRSVYIDRFKVLLSIIEDGDSLVAEFHYDSNKLSGDDVNRLARQFHRLVESVVGNPGSLIEALEIVPLAEKHRLLVEYNDTDATLPDDKYLPAVFEKQVEKAPDTIAVVFEDEYLSFDHLNRRANQLARHLLSLGVSAGDLVAIYVDRSLELLISILGTLKAGAAYVPLDPEWPRDRLAFVLEQTCAPVILTQRRLTDCLPGNRAISVSFDPDWESIQRHNDDNLMASAGPDSPAYVIYTSGSTGEPKGAVIHHRGLINYLSWAASEYVAEGLRGAPVHSSIGFDLTVTSLFVPLLVGQSVVLLAEARGIEALSTALATAGDFSLVKITPAHLEALSHQLTPVQAAAAARVVVIGGEALLGEALSFWRTHVPDIRLINEYGPTETVVGCCIFEVDAETPFSGPIPIGRPIANTQLYVLDSNLNALPTGVPGELLIGGAGLANGYLRDPALTAQRFIPNHYSAKPGSRLYRTGDLARHLPDEGIEFIGRIDNQVKIRGYRIELGEIESVLRQHSAIYDAVVLAREDVPGDRRLVAYIVPDPQAAPAQTELRHWLREKLPEYMIPPSWMMLKSLPLTPNGKIDRKQLPQPDKVRLDMEQLFVAPRTFVEEELARLWRELLGVDVVGIHDNFFDLGGHSLLLTQLLSRIREDFEVDLLLGTLFDNQTIAQMAAIIAVAHAEQGDADEVYMLLNQIKDLSPEAAKEMLELEEPK
jgi:amino acid adenylation domain-containing protein